MANPKSKVLPEIINVYLFIMLAHCADVFVVNLMGDSKAFGTNFYGHAVGLLVIFIACMIKKIPAPDIGIVLKPRRIFKGLYRGAIFSLIPIAIVAVICALIYLVTGWERMKLQFLPPNINYSPYGVLGSSITYGFSIIVSVMLKELFFRGYVIKQARRVYSFTDTMIIQTVLYIPIPLINHFKNIAYGLYPALPHYWILMGSIVVFYIFHEALTAIKWGLLRRVSKDIWLVFFDHYIYNFIGFSLFLSQSKISNFDILFKLSAVQIISFLMTLIYYKKKRAEKEKKQLEKKLRKLQDENLEEKELEQRNKRHSQENEEILERFNPDEINRKVENYTSHSRRHHRPSSKAREQDIENINSQKLENYSQDSIDKYVSGYNKQYMHSMGSHHKHSDSQPQKDEKLMDLDELNIDDFYKEYAKEMERQKKENN